MKSIKYVLLLLFISIFHFSCSDSEIEGPEKPYKVNILLSDIYNFEITNCQYRRNSDSLIEITAEDQAGNWFILEIETSRTDSSQIMYRLGENIYTGKALANYFEYGDDLAGNYDGWVYSNGNHFKLNGEFLASQNEEDPGQEFAGIFYLSKVSMDWEEEEGTLTYYLPMRTEITAVVYDASGKVVSTIYDKGWMPSGVGKLKIDFKPFSSGVYSLLFEAFGQKKIEKFVVAKPFNS